MEPKKGFKKIAYLFKETFSECINDNVLKLSAALSYYTIFSLPPLLIIVTSLCGIYYGPEAVRGELYGQIQGFVGSKAAVQIQEIIKSVNVTFHNTFAAIVGVIILVVGASGIFAEIQDSINYIWGIKAKPKRGLLQFVINRLMSFFMIVAAGVLLLAGLLINSLVDLLNKRMIPYHPPETLYLYHVFNFLLLFLLITFLFVAIFKTLPDGKVAFRDSLLGASLTAVFFMGGKYLIGAYLTSSGVGSVYGAAGSVILILAWIYYSAIILYFGAEFTKIYSHTYGKKIIPNEYTVLIKKPAENH
jgi:membrane protein